MLQTLKQIANGESKSLKEYNLKYGVQDSCQVCGSISNLTKHHIIPKHFKVKTKILTLCVGCHREVHGFRPIGNNRKKRKKILQTSIFNKSYEKVINLIDEYSSICIKKIKVPFKDLLIAAEITDHSTRLFLMIKFRDGCNFNLYRTKNNLSIHDLDDNKSYTKNLIFNI